jgi:predicted  nucleic acid-binding Zn-ribbon protein
VASEVGERDEALYQRVASRRHPAVASLSGDACGGCHLPLSIEERRQVRTGGGVVQCSNCDRILVA